LEKPGERNEGRKTMRKITTLIISAVFVALVVAAGPIRAQESTTSLIKQLREDTERFGNSVDKALDRSSIDGSRLEDEINAYVKSFEEQIGILKGDWEEKRDTTKASAEELMVRGRKINNFLKEHNDRFKSPVHTEWKSVKLDIGRIAKANNLKLEW
jgi:hypothetical protein